jgi:hypothetical protein
VEGNEWSFTYEFCWHTRFRANCGNMNFSGTATHAEPLLQSGISKPDDLSSAEKSAESQRKASRKYEKL